MNNPLQLFEITPGQIDDVMRLFYARIRQHEVLGPVFSAHIKDGAWPAHEAKIAGFWRNAILKERSYSGSPMMAHMQSPHVQPEHFELWLGLFDETLAETLPEPTRTQFSALAHRIGKGLRLGLQQVRQTKAAPPVLD
ncbi:MULTISPECIES: group III truncated hemoglobin [Shimia]|uniref:group III truncated hemoglobin n=1 Tax=Shimia TaxID=573139 RepID=UPI001FB2A5CA|nr:MULTISPECIES: group III truncated hemoglobin [Shimia]MDV4145943.1 group III truncated hemoglobin [Shimia sp. FJ5]